MLRFDQWVVRFVFETLLSQHWRGGSNNHPCQINISVRKILTRVVREFVGKGFRVETLCKNVETHVRETHASILKGPRRARSQTYTYFWIILARLGRHKSNMKSMHARKLWARMRDTLNDALPPWEYKVKLIHATEDMCMSVFYKWSLLIGDALDNMTARTCTLFYWAVCDERRPGAILDRYRTGAAGDSKGLQERDSKEPGLNHTAEQSPPRSQVPK